MKQMVALVFGQSNAANHGNRRGEAPPAVNVFHNGDCHPAIDPLPGGSGTGGSVWTRLGCLLIGACVFESITFVPVAIGGAAVRDWAPGGACNPLLLDTLESMRQKSITPTHLFWHQGERDTFLGTSKRGYKQAFLLMLEDIRTRQVDAPVYVSTATYRFGVINQEVRAAQREVIDIPRGILAGPDSDVLGSEYRYDDCHFTSAGLDAFADLWMKCLISAK